MGEIFDMRYRMPHHFTANVRYRYCCSCGALAYRRKRCGTCWEQN